MQSMMKVAASMAMRTFSAVISHLSSLPPETPPHNQHNNKNTTRSQPLRPAYASQEGNRRTTHRSPRRTGPEYCQHWRDCSTLLNLSHMLSQTAFFIKDSKDDCQNHNGRDPIPYRIRNRCCNSRNSCLSDFSEFLLSDSCGNERHLRPRISSINHPMQMHM